MIVGVDRDGPEVFERTLRFLDTAGIDGGQPWRRSWAVTRR